MSAFEDWQAVERVAAWASENLNWGDPLRNDIDTLFSLIPDDAYADKPGAN